MARTNGKIFHSNHIIDDETKLCVANLYLDQERWQWWQGHCKCYARTITQQMFAKSICDRFDHESNFLCHLTKLRQTGTKPSKDLNFRGKKETKKPKGLFSVGISLLQVHGLIQKQKIIVSINPSCKHNFINVNLVKKIISSSKTNGFHTS